MPGVATIWTPDLAALLEQQKPLVVDAMPLSKSIQRAVGLMGVGIGGNVPDEFQDRIRQKMTQLTHGDHNVPVVTVGWNVSARVPVPMPQAGEVLLRVGCDCHLRQR